MSTKTHNSESGSLEEIACMCTLQAYVTTIYSELFKHTAVLFLLLLLILLAFYYWSCLNINNNYYYYYYYSWFFLYPIIPGIMCACLCVGKTKTNEGVDSKMVVPWDYVRV